MPATLPPDFFSILPFACLFAPPKIGQKPVVEQVPLFTKSISYDKTISHPSASNLLIHSPDGRYHKGSETSENKANRRLMLGASTDITILDASLVSGEMNNEFCRWIGEIELITLRFYCIQDAF